MQEAEQTAPRPTSLAAYRTAGRADILHGETRALHDYWQALRAGRTVPYRTEIDPRDMTCQASRLFIIEARDDGAQRFRLAGSVLTEVLGVELRGMPSRAIMDGPSRDTFTALISEMLAEPGLAYARLHAVSDREDGWELLMLPLRSDGGAIDRLIGILQPIGDHRRRAAPMIRFTLDQVQIRPIATTASSAARPVAGFAEAAEPFGPGLIAIEGGGRAGRAEWRPRPLLRVVKDD